MVGQSNDNSMGSLDADLPAIPNKRYFTIGEVSELCLVKPHVMRYWEQVFPQLKPVKRRGNRRYYQRHDVLLIRKIRSLLYEKDYTIGGARAQLSSEAGEVSEPEAVGEYRQIRVELDDVLNILRGADSSSQRDEVRAKLTNVIDKAPLSKDRLEITTDLEAIENSTHLSKEKFGEIRFSIVSGEYLSRYEIFMLHMVLNLGIVMCFYPLYVFFSSASAGVLLISPALLITFFSGIIAFVIYFKWDYFR